jgi:hypothetical protein
MNLRDLLKLFCALLLSCPSPMDFFLLFVLRFFFQIKVQQNWGKKLCFRASLKKSFIFVPFLIVLGNKKKFYFCCLRLSESSFFSEKWNHGSLIWCELLVSFSVVTKLHGKIIQKKREKNRSKIHIENKVDWIMVCWDRIFV